jgi:antitoxin component of RelBE/YafQ-DinJ toxin-antitoxin module
MESNRTITVSSYMTVEMLDKARAILKDEHISTSEFIRLSIAHLVETGKPPFEIPEDQRGKAKRHGQLKKSVGATFFS